MKKNNTIYNKVITVQEIDSELPYLLSLSGFKDEEDDEVLSKIKENYEYFAISIFQKGLQENDYNNSDVLTHYQQISSYTGKNKTNLINNYKSIKKSFVAFFHKLYLHGLYTHDNPNYVTQIHNYSILLRCVKDGLKEKRFKNYLIPTLGVIVTSSFDFTLYVYASKKHYKKDTFEKIVKNSGLYILK